LIELLVPGNLPDVILLDLQMPEMNGLETTNYVKANFPDIKIILLTLHNNESYISLLMENGANSYLVKNENPEVLEKAIIAVVEKDYFFSDYVSKALLNKNKKREPLNQGFQIQHKVKFSSRELEILKLICQQYTSPEIAKKLFITVRTVEGHRRNLLEKASVRNTAGLVIFAIKNDLFDFSTGLNDLH
jgi:Response regulator containing a CheY-like receiver domain and an HTH DNA-binding domain